MKRIAVVGSGVAGLTAAWALRQHANVTMYEADRRLGGHAHSHVFDRPDGGQDVVDSGFIVMNNTTYPTLVRLFNELQISTRPAEMSMSVSCTDCGLEYAGARGLSGLLTNHAALQNRRYWRMLLEVPRFHRAARTLLRDDPTSVVTLRTFLDSNNFSQYFIDHFAIPLVACVWSCPPGMALDYPASYLFTFLNNHGMLRISGSPQWRTVVGGSREYVKRIAAAVPDIRLKTAVSTVARHSDGVTVTAACGTVDTYQSVVIATHPHQALAMLVDATPLEKEVLGAFEYSPNLVQLSNDESLLPTSERARACWNYQTNACDGSNDPPVTITYDMNRLQGIDSPNRYLVSLNAATKVHPYAVRRRMEYEHPQYTPRSVAAQLRLPELNSPQLAFAGAYHGWGFHEDGARSGASAARMLGGQW